MDRTRRRDGLSLLVAVASRLGLGPGRRQQLEIRLGNRRGWPAILPLLPNIPHGPSTASACAEWTRLSIRPSLEKSGDDPRRPA
jgi:hypothetical protein